MLSDNSLPNMMIQSRTNNHLSLINNHLAFGIFTTVEESLQINLFMQNEPNLPKAQMNVNKVLIRDYENKPNWTLGENEPKTNPIKAKFKKAKMNVTTIITKGYENKTPIRAPKKQTQISKRQKPMQTSLPQRIMKNTAFSGHGKTNPNKANFTSAQRPVLPALSAVEGSHAEGRRTAVRCRMYALVLLSFVHETDENNRSPSLLIAPMLPIYPVRKPAYRKGMIFSANLRNRGGFNTPYGLFNGVYKPANARYYSRRKCRCSSMVERSFRKAEVEGSTPSIGCMSLVFILCKPKSTEPSKKGKLNEMFKL